MPGVFITLEGGDGVGKTTQFELLAEALRAKGYSVCKLHEPGGTALGERVRELLLRKNLGEIDPVAELMLFEAARAQIVSEVIRPALAEGKVVLCDRFADSTLAYQGFGRELDVELCNVLNAAATGGLSPCRTIVLALDRNEAASRISARSEDGEGDRMESAGSAFHQRVAAGFEALAAAEPERVRVVDAAGSIEEVHGRVMAAVDGVLPSIKVTGASIGGEK